MLQNTATLEKRYQQFIQTICQNEQVFALKLPQQDQYAFLPSAHEEYEDGEPVGVVCFWSSAARAIAAAKNGQNTKSPRLAWRNFWKAGVCCWRAMAC